MQPLIPGVRDRQALEKNRLVRRRMRVEAHRVREDRGSAGVDFLDCGSGRLIVYYLFFPYAALRLCGFQ